MSVVLEVGLKVALTVFLWDLKLVHIVVGLWGYSMDDLWVEMTESKMEYQKVYLLVVMLDIS